jgi:hypothetical protein
VNCAHSKPIRVICQHRMMGNRLTNGLVIYLIVPEINKYYN